MIHYEGDKRTAARQNGGLAWLPRYVRKAVGVVTLPLGVFASFMERDAPKLCRSASWRAKSSVGSPPPPGRVLDAAASKNCKRGPPAHFCASEATAAEAAKEETEPATADCPTALAVVVSRGMANGMSSIAASS
jgi:hypothetical protein